MSFGYGMSDGALLVQLAWRTVQGARQACGEYDELTREVTSLHRVLQRLHREVSNPDSPLNRADDERREELNELGNGCEQILNVMNAIVTKYNMLPDNERSGKRIWQKVKFGNGEMKDLAEIRVKLSAHTSALIMSLNLCSLGSQIRVEKQLNSVGGDLEGIRAKVDWIAANMAAKNGDRNGTIWTSYTNDDKAFWRELRRELVKEGYHSSVLHKHKHLLKEYVEELGSRGVFDNMSDEESSEEEAEEKERNGVETQDVNSALSNHGDENLEDEDTEHTDSESVPSDDAGPESDDSKGSGSEDSELDELGYNEADTPRLGAEDEPEPTSDTVESEQPSRNALPRESSKFPMPVQIEELVDEEYAPYSHPNTFEPGERDQDAEETEVDPSGSPQENDQEAEVDSGSPPQNAALSQTTDPQSVSNSLTSTQPPSEKL